MKAKSLTAFTAQQQGQAQAQAQLTPEQDRLMAEMLRPCTEAQLRKLNRFELLANAYQPVITNADRIAYLRESKPKLSRWQRLKRYILGGLALGLGLALASTIATAQDAPAAANTRLSPVYVCTEWVSPLALANGLSNARGFNPLKDCLAPIAVSCNTGTCYALICKEPAKYADDGNCE